MRLRDIHHYDTYVPILADLQTRHTWDQAVELVLAALEPLGSDYCGVLERGLRGRWCDRYENRGKQSGAFSRRLLRRRPVHPHELPARRARPRLHAGPRGGPLDAQLLLGQDTSPTPTTTTRSSWPRWPARSTSNCSSRHLLDHARDDQRAGVPHQPPDRRHARHDLPADDVRRVREARPTPRPRRASR